MFTLNEGQTHLDKPNEKNSLEDSTVAVARELIKAICYWKPEYRKLLVMCLTKINWKQNNNSEVVELSKSEVLEVLKIEIDADHQAEYLKKLLRKFRQNSEIIWTDENDSSVWDEGYLIDNVNTQKRGKIKVRLNGYYMPMLEDLLQRQNYLKMWSNDQYQFRSKFTFALYDALQLRYDFRYIQNYIGFTTNQLKQIFGLSEKEYVRPKNGQFDRQAFEKKVLDVAITEINSANGMMIIRQNGRNRSGKLQFYEKTKLDGYVKEYVFKVQMFPKWKDNDQIIDQDAQTEINDFMDKIEASEAKAETEISCFDADADLPFKR